MKNRKLFINSTLVVVSIICSLYLLDITLQNILYPYENNQIDLKFDFKTRPYIYRSETIQKLNSPVKMDSNDFHIVVIGDSFTYGHGVKSEETFPAYLETLLGIKNKNIKVTNAGVSAANYVDYYVILDRLLKKIDPDLVIISATNNDIFFNEWNFSPAKVCDNITDNSILSKLIKFSSILYYIHHRYGRYYGNYESSSAQLTECGVQYVDKIVDRLKAASIPTLFTYHNSSFKHEKYCERYHTLKHLDASYFKRTYGQNSLFITQAVVSGSCKFDETFYYSDNYHINKNGNKLIAQLIYDELIKKKLVPIY